MKTRVYYADTDAGGVVYYANYLRWLEMARFEFLERFGVSVTEYARQGFVFAKFVYLYALQIWPAP